MSVCVYVSVRVQRLTAVKKAISPPSTISQTLPSVEVISVHTYSKSQTFCECFVVECSLSADKHVKLLVTDGALLH